MSQKFDQGEKKKLTIAKGKREGGGGVARGYDPKAAAENERPRTRPLFRVCSCRIALWSHPTLYQGAQQNICDKLS